MKRAILFTICNLLLLSTGLLKSQTFLNTSILPYQTNASPVFGKDIVIHDMPDRDQRNIAICSAFNGWLYGVHSYLDGDLNYISFIRSVDEGLTWEIINEGSSFGGYLTLRYDIIVCGNNLTDMRIFLSQVAMDTISYEKFGVLFNGRYFAEPFAPDTYLFGDAVGWYKDVAMAYDKNFPATNSNPFSIAILYSKTGIKDSLIFHYSENGGQSFDNRRVVTVSNHKIEKVALAFGRSASYPEGRYFAAWEEKDTPNATTGHIYTAHTEPYFNSPFTTPVCLVSLDSYYINRGRNPVIACQMSNNDNNYGNLTEVVLFERYVPSLAKYDIAGFYNTQATTSNQFQKFSISSSQDNKLQPDINFNSYKSEFMVTYFDSTTRKLPFLTHDINMTNPDSWTVVSSCYNDSTNIIKPWPKVELSQSKQDGFNVWTQERSTGNGMSMFDATYSTYTGLEGKINENSEISIRAFPNPCDNKITMFFNLKKAEKISIRLFNTAGLCIGTVTDNFFSEGKHFINYDTSKLPQSTYYFILSTDKYSLKPGKITIIR